MFPSSFRAVFLLALLSGSCYSAAAETCYEKYAPPPGGRYYSRNLLNDVVTAGDYWCVKWLLNEGEDPNSSDASYVTPLMAAARQNKGGIAKLLMSYGANPNIKTPSGDTAIMNAACAGATDVIKVMADAGVSTDITNKGGATTYDSACSCYDSPTNCDKTKAKELLNAPIIAVYFSHDFSSSDGVLNDGTKDITANNRECRNKCANKNGCKVWTRIKRTVSGGSKEGECWLRSYQPTAAYCDYCDSGVMSCEVHDKTDYTTSDDLIGYGIVDGKTKSDQDCCALCYGIIRCRSWTWIKWDTKYNKKGECWLRSGFSQSHYNNGAASGQIKKNGSQ